MSKMSLLLSPYPFTFIFSHSTANAISYEMKPYSLTMPTPHCYTVKHKS